MIDTSISPCVLAVSGARWRTCASGWSGTGCPQADRVPAGADPWSRGVPLAELEALREHWFERYDWRRFEAELAGGGPRRTRGGLECLPLSWRRAAR